MNLSCRQIEKPYQHYKTNQMSKLKITGIILLFTVVAVSLYAWLYIWNKPQLNVEDSKAVKVTAAALFSEYSSNEKEANSKYIDKVVEVTGEINSVSKNSEGKTVVLLKTDDLMFGVNCTLEQAADVKAGESISLKGICTGYLTDVVLIRCYKTN